jgi:hypothetical protein
VRRRGLVLGELRELGETRYGWRILLRHQRTPFYLSTSAWDGLRRAYPHVLAEQLPEGGSYEVTARTRTPANRGKLILPLVFLTRAATSSATDS